MIGTADLLAVAHAYAAGAGVSLTTVSSRVFDDGKKLSAIEAGSDIYSGRLNRAIQWFSDNWPDGAVWPPGVPRPAISTAAA